MSDKAKGHGHVTPNANGDKARCGGPKICKVCQQELAALKSQARGSSLSQASLTAAVDAAMVEMQNISPPLGRGDCARLIRAALARLNQQPASGGDPIGYFVQPYADMPHVIERVDGSCAGDADVFPLYRHPALTCRPDHSEDVRQMVPEGWRLVPVDMTPEMYSAFCEARGVVGTTYKDGWKAALAAAPSPSKQGGE